MAVWFDRVRRRWRHDFQRHGARHHGYTVDPDTQAPARSRSDAKRIEKILKARATLRPAPAATAAPGTYTFGQAVAARWQAIENNRASGEARDLLRELLAWFGAETAVDAVEHRIAAYIAWSYRQPVRVWIGGPRKRDDRDAQRYWKPLAGRTRQAATINRYLDQLRATLTLAHTTRDPATRRPLLDFMPAVPRQDEPEEAPRPINDADLDAIAREAPRHVRDTIALCVAFGLRMREATQLEREQVDQQNGGIWLDSSTKGKRGEFLPGTRAAMKLLARLAEDARSTGQRRLVLYRLRLKDGSEKIRPIARIKSSWYTALARAGLDGRHKFHNTRAAYVTALAHRAPAAVVQDLARHKDPETTMRYVKIADPARRAAVDALDDWRVLGTIAPGAKIPTRKPHTATPLKTQLRIKSLKKLASPG